MCIGIGFLYFAKGQMTLLQFFPQSSRLFRSVVSELNVNPRYIYQHFFHRKFCTALEHVLNLCTQRRIFHQTKVHCPLSFYRPLYIVSYEKIITQ